MAFGQPIEFGIREKWIDWSGCAFIRTDEGWTSCRISFSKWDGSSGEWVEFAGYRARNASRFLKETCVHRPGVPRSFDHVELNFSPAMKDGDGNQMLHDPIVEKTNPGKLHNIMSAHKGDSDDFPRAEMENFHLVCRKDKRNLVLELIIEDVDYEFAIHGVHYSCLGLDAPRMDEAFNHSSALQPCADCASDNWVSMSCKVENVHGRYRSGLVLTGPTSIAAVMEDGNWLEMSVGKRKMLIPNEIIQSLCGYRFKELLVFPTVSSRV